MTSTHHTNASETLIQLSNLAGQQFRSMEDATQAILKTIGEVMGMRTSWISRADTEDGLLVIEAAHNLPGGFDISAGATAPLELSFCSLIVQQSNPGPLIIEDTRNDPEFLATAAAKAFPNVGSYVGVPIVMSDGSIHGTLCSCDRSAVQVNDQQVQLLSVLSRLLATQIELDRELEARARAESRFNGFMDHTPAVAYMKDPEGRYVYVNQHWSETFSLDRDWIIGRTDHDLLNEASANVAEHRDRAVLRSQHAHRNYDTHVGADGDLHYWYSIRFPVKDGDDVLFGGVAVDVTEKYAQDTERSLLAAIVNDTQDAIYARTLEGIVTAWNPAAERLYGYSAKEMIGSTISAILPENSVDEFTKLDSVVREDGTVSQHRTVQQVRSGRLVDIELSMSLIRDDDSTICGISTIARDVTEHTRLIAERDKLYTDLQSEVLRAAEIQAHFLPTTVPNLPGFEFAAICSPALEVGGDFYDWSLSSGQVRLTLGDVTGKGLAAALLMATTRAALRGAANEPIDQAISTVNRAMMTDLSHSDAFVTMFHADLEEEGCVTYTDAGHGLALILRKDGSFKRLAQGQRPIGLFDTDYFSSQVCLDPGDVLIVYSDGLPDARPDLQLDKPEKLAAICEPCENVNEIVATLRELALRNGPQPDDFTVIAVGRQDQTV